MTHQILKALVLLLLVSSCTSKDHVGAFVEFQEAGWNVDSLARFRFKPEAIGNKKELYAIIRYSNDYPFYNIGIRYGVSQVDSTGFPQRVVVRDTVNADLFHSKNGVPFGEEARPSGKGVGLVFEREILLSQNIQVTGTEMVQLDMQHNLRPATLGGIYAVGFRFK